MSFYDKKENFTSGKGNTTIYFYLEIKVIKQIHLTKCDDEKGPIVGLKQGLYMNWRLAKIL